MLNATRCQAETQLNQQILSVGMNSGTESLRIWADVVACSQCMILVQVFGVVLRKRIICMDQGGVSMASMRLFLSTIISERFQRYLLVNARHSRRWNSRTQWYSSTRYNSCRSAY